MKFQNTLAATLLMAGALLTACKSNHDPQPTVGPAPSFIKLTVSEAGAPAYDLKEARLLNANYQTGSSNLSSSGKLNSGQTLLLNFSKGSATTPYTTASLSTSLDGVAGTSPSGNTTYNPQTKTVSGSFQTTFVGVGVVTGSFTDIQL